MWWMEGGIYNKEGGRAHTHNTLYCRLHICAQAFKDAQIALIIESFHPLLESWSKNQTNK